MKRFAARARFFAVAALAMPALSSCSADGRETRWGGVVHRTGEVVEVENPGTPVFGADAASENRVWNVPPQADGATAGWSAPSRLALGPGEVYVLDPMAHAVHVLSRSGEPLRRVGRAGRGPGEFGNTFGVALVNGLLAVGNSGPARVDLFTASGEHARSVDLGVPAFSLDAVDPGGLLVKTARGEQRLYDVEGGNRVIPFAPFGSAERAAPSDCLRVAGAGEHIVQMDCTTPAFHVVTRDGRRVRTVRVRRDPVPASTEELDRYRNSLAAEMASGGGLPPDQARGLLDDLTRSQNPKRLIRGIRYDRSSGLYAVWEQQPRELGTGPARLHLFGDKGVFLASIDFRDAWIDFAIDDLTVYALTEDPDTGLAGLSAHRLNLASELLAFAPTAPEEL